MTQLSSAQLISAQLISAQLISAQLISAQLIRHCTGCDEERLFEQFHAEPASCPDVMDGDCQEWACTVCGDALIIGLPAPGHVHGDSARAA